MGSVTDLIAVLRSELDDPVITDYPADQLWSDQDLGRYLREAEREFCYKTEILRDGDTPKVTRIQLQPRVPSYPLDPSVISIIEATIPNYRRIPLIKRDFKWIQSTFLDWRRRTGVPDYICTDYKPEQVMFFPIPHSVDLVYGAATVELFVTRTSILEFNLVDLDDAEFEIPVRYHERLLNWAKHKAYLKQDTETYDLEKSDKFKATWEQDMLQVFQAIWKRKWVPRITRYYGV